MSFPEISEFNIDYEYFRGFEFFQRCLNFQWFKEKEDLMLWLYDLKTGIFYIILVKLAWHMGMSQKWKTSVFYIVQYGVVALWLYVKLLRHELLWTALCQFETSHSHLWRSNFHWEIAHTRLTNGTAGIPFLVRCLLWEDLVQYWGRVLHIHGLLQSWELGKIRLNKSGRAI